MTVKSDSLIGKRVVNLYEKVSQEFGGFDTGEVFLLLDTGEALSFPIKLEYNNCLVPKDRISNHDSIFDMLYKKDTNWKIKDLIEPHDDFLSLPYIELECGLLFSEETVSPNGTGMAGIRLFSNLEEFESRFGKKYTRLSEQ